MVLSSAWGLRQRHELPRCASCRGAKHDCGADSHPAPCVLPRVAEPGAPQAFTARSATGRSGPAWWRRACAPRRSACAPPAVVCCPLCPSMRHVRACRKARAGRAAARAACRQAFGADCAAGPRRRAGKSRVRYTQKELLFIHQWTRGAPSAPRHRRRPRPTQSHPWRSLSQQACHVDDRGVLLVTSGVASAQRRRAGRRRRRVRRGQRAAAPLTGRAPARADFFISALNTKLWILILIITLVYLVTFFIFGGIWWAVYLCAPPSPPGSCGGMHAWRDDLHVQVVPCVHLSGARTSLGQR